MLSAIPTDTLARLNDLFKMAGWILAAMAAVALALEWVTGRELEKHRARDSAALREQLAIAQRKAAPRQISPE